MKKGLALVVLLVYLSPNIFFPKQARFLIHDNLNSNIVWYKNLAETKTLLSGNHETVSRTLHGIERGFYPTEAYFVPWLFVAFDAVTAYNVNVVLIHLIAFLGMFLLLRRHLFSREDEDSAVFCALLFSLLPFLPGNGITIAGQPLALFAILNVFKGERKMGNYFILLFFLFYSNFFFGNLFFFSCLLLVFTAYFLWKRQWDIHVLLLIGSCLFLSFLSEHRLISMALIEQAVLNRADMSPASALNFFGMIGLGIKYFFFGQYHAQDAHFPFVLGICLLAIFLAKDVALRNRIVVVLGCAGILSLMYSFFSWDLYSTLFGRFMPHFQMRFHVLTPLVWYLALAYSMYSLKDVNRPWSIIIKGALWVQLIWLFLPILRTDLNSDDYTENSFYRTYVNSKSPDYATFDDYYSTDLFRDMKEIVDPKSGYVACLGIEDEVAQFNGYNTLGGYYAVYSSDYFNQFQELISNELKKDERRLSFRKCRFFSSELSAGKDSIQNLSWDFEAMKKMNCRTVISSNVISMEQLSNEQIFVGKEETLYVYTIN